MPVPTIDVSGIVDATIASASKWLTPFNNIKTFLTDLTAGNAGVPVERLLWGTQSASIVGTTLSAITKKYVIVDTDGSATQNLATITGPVQGHEIVLEMANAGRVVTVKHGTGNIFLWGGQDVTLAVGKVLHLFRTSTGWSDVTITGSAATQENILPNSSFEAWERGIAAAPDGWTLAGAGATIAQEATTIYHGVYSAKITRVGADATFVADIYSRFGKTYPRSKQITFSAWVFSATASIARLRINDGVTVSNSSYHPGGSAWAKLSVTATVGAAITALTVGLEVNSTNGSAFIDAAAVSEGTLVANYVPDVLMFNQFPRRAVMFHGEATVLTGSTFVTTINSSQAYNFTTAVGASANGDSFSHGCFLSAGTYTFSVLGQINVGSPKIDWYFDNVLQVSAQDWYNGSTVNNTIKTASVTLTHDGYHVIKGVINGRNASNSTNWRLELTKYWLKQSAD